MRQKIYHSFFIKSFIILLTIILSIAVYGNTTSVNPEINIRLLNTLPLEISDPIDILLTVKSNKEATINYPINDKSFSPFRIINIKKKVKIGINYKKISVIYTIHAYTTGNVVLNPLKIIVNGKKYTTNPLIIHIKSSLKDKNIKNINDIYKPFKNPGIFIFLILIISSLLLLLIVTKLYNRIVRLIKGKKDKTVKNNNITTDPTLIFFTDLVALVLSDDSIKIKYYKLSIYIRNILGLILGINLKAMTTGKIVKLLNKSNLYNSKDIIKFLYIIDNIKFKPVLNDEKYKQYAESELKTIVEKLKIIINELLSDDLLKLKFPEKS